MIENWGDYFWAGQIDDCLANKLGIHDAEQLRLAEGREALFRGADLITGRVAVPQTFDLEHLRAIHRHLFHGVYEWAGDLRVTELVRPSTDPNEPGNEFVKPDQIEDMAEQLVFPQADPAALRQLGRDDQVDQLAKTYASLNVLHPFVEGNGRTQRIFLQDLAATGGLAIDWGRMPQQNDVMKEAFSVGYQPVADALRACVVDTTDRPAFEAARLTALTRGSRAPSTGPTQSTREGPDQGGTARRRPPPLRGPRPGHER